MFILDTNVVSELRRPDRVHPAVFAWATAAPLGSVYLSVVTMLELELGVLLMERRDAARGAILRAWLEEQVRPRFAGRMLVVDETTARRCAHLHAEAPRAERDALIAATALTHRLTVVTRNVGDFEPMGVALLNPWLTQAA